jgi:hypothetical protein
MENRYKTNVVHDKDIKGDSTISHRLVERRAKGGKHAKDRRKIKRGDVN